MKLTQTQNLRVEDYPDQTKWIGRMFIVLNAFFTNVGQAFDGNIDFATNIRSVTREYDTSSVQFPITFDWPFQQAQPVDLRITKALAGSSAVALIPAWQYDASNHSVSITALHQLQNGAVAAVATGTRYKFTVRATV